MFSVITNINNKKTKGPTLMEFFTARGNLKKFFFARNLVFLLLNLVIHTLTAMLYSVITLQD